jgi:hypothetical protein
VHAAQWFVDARRRLREWRASGRNATAVPVYSSASSFLREPGQGQIMGVGEMAVRCTGVLVLALAGTVAAEPWDPGEALDTCILAVVGERPGIVTGWRQAGGGTQPPYAISVLNQDGRVGETTCDPANPANFRFDEKVGVLRYSMYKRATVPEVRARVSAPEIFAGPVRMHAMELTVSLTGSPYYTYRMFLPSGHQASVRIDAAAGRLVSAEVK